jgi:ATP-binding cassette, subfamily D (ALD), peroxisomal long-chain fatty acid import protein
MYAYKDLLELAGLTTRIYTLLSTLHNLPSLPLTEHGDTIELIDVDVGIPPTGTTGAQEVDLEGHEMLVQEPTQVLVKDLSLVLKEEEHLMITGSNGVGKTAVARVLAGLWAGQGSDARVSRPSQSPTGVSNGKPQPRVVVVPQRAYMVTGSLLAQIIYPHSHSDFLESGKSEDDLMDILEAVYLGYLPEREGGWATRKEWRDVLSGGEKQRVSQALLFDILVLNNSARWDWPGFSTIDLNSPFWMVSRCAKA